MYENGREFHNITAGSSYLRTANSPILYPEMNLHSINWQLGDFVRYKPCPALCQMGYWIGETKKIEQNKTGDRLNTKVNPRYGGK